MAFELFSKVALKTEVALHKLKPGDVATVVEFHAAAPGQEPGYTLEVFNAVGETIAVVTARESQIEALNSKDVLHVRRLEEIAA